MTQAFQPEHLVLFCPRCGSQHEDLGEWATRPHRTHLCLFCKHEWAPRQHKTIGVPVTPPAGPIGPGRYGVIVPHAVFARMHEYSCTMPTRPKPGRFWRRRVPYTGLDRSSEHYLAVVIPGPEGAEHDLIVWRRLYVAEWLLVDALLQADGEAA